MDRRFMFMKNKNVLMGLSSPLPRGCTNVHDHNIQTSSSLKPLGQSKPNVMWSIVRKGELKLI